MTTDDYLAFITSEHKDKQNFMAMMKALVDPLVDRLNFLNVLNSYFDQDTATGDQLQVIADWCGAPNSIPNSIVIPFFGFSDQAGTLGFGETDDSSVGGYWRDSGMAGYKATSISTDLLRKVIKAQILLNSSDCSESSAKSIISLVTDKQFKFKDNLDMTITFTFLETYGIQDKELVRLMFPRPSGVKLIFEGEYGY
ncbi:DUF2612 domain-containing protein [Acinetobacter baumannii]